MEIITNSSEYFDRELKLINPNECPFKSEPTQDEIVKMDFDSVEEPDEEFIAQMERDIAVAQYGGQAFIRKKGKTRNQPCPCGSGKKYKNCCMNEIS